MLDVKVVLITGASSGIGQETAELLARSGHTVFGTSRNPSRQETAQSFTLLPLDVHSETSVRRCVDSVIDRAGRIDVLINNAGYVISGGVEEISMEQAGNVFETNFFGIMRMCQAVLPSMRRLGRGRIINISSLAGLTPIPFCGLYNASKFALEGLTESLRYELRPLNILVSLVEPGFVRTGLVHSAQVCANPLPVYEAARQRAWARVCLHEESGLEPHKVAETVLKIVGSKNPKLRYPLGKGLIYYRLRRIMPGGLYERGARFHWNLDEKPR